MFGVIVVLLALLPLFLIYLRLRNDQRRLPPGPPRDPLVGSVRYMTTPVWRWAYECKAKYGDLIYYKVSKSICEYFQLKKLIISLSITYSDR